MEQVTLLHGDALEVLRTLPDNSVDAIVTDPPGGISFMGREWDSDKGGRDNWIAAFSEIARECLRVVKPGAHALVWAIPRTSHWTATAWENGGWEVRDRVAHVFGSGFPKSLDVSKAIDKAAGHERGTTPDFRNGPNTRPTKGIGKFGGYPTGQDDLDAGPATDAAKEHAGKGTALKPAMEDWWLLRKPLTGTIAQNVLEWGTGALNIDACRVGYVNDADKVSAQPQGEWTGKPSGHINEPLSGRKIERDSMGKWEQPAGRWPAHLIHDGSDEVVAMFPQTTSGTYRPPVSRLRNNGIGLGTTDERHGTSNAPDNYGDTGSAARFFYVAKASKRDRDEGLEGFEARQYSHDGRETPIENPYQRNDSKARNHHPTVKPTELMRYLCRLITPAGGVVLDPFAGSGSTGKGAVLEGFSFIGIEREADYIDIARARIAWAQRQQPALIGDE